MEFGLLLHLLLLLVTNIGCEETNDSEVIYSAKADGVEFGKVTVLHEVPNVETALWYMEGDKAKQKHYIIADGSSLKTFNYDHNPLEQTTLIGETLSHSYREGNVTEARFDTITAFTQVNITHIIVVDSNNHCLRCVNRPDLTSSSYAGKCQSHGNINGELTAARFNYPRQTVLRNSQLYLTDLGNRAIRKINTAYNEVTTYISLDDTPYAITYATTGNAKYEHLFVTTTSRVLQINQKDRSVEALIPSSIAGIHDGPFEVAKVNRPYAISIVSEHVLLLAEARNNRLRVVNLMSRNVSSICDGDMEFSDITNSINTCSLIQPLSLLPIDYYEAYIMIGTNTTEMRRLKYRKAPLEDPTVFTELQKPTTLVNDAMEDHHLKQNSTVLVATLVAVGLLLALIVASVFLVFYIRKSKANSRLQSQTSNMSTGSEMKGCYVSDVQREDMSEDVDVYAEYLDVRDDGDDCKQHSSMNNTICTPRSGRIGPLPKRPNSTESTHDIAPTSDTICGNSAEEIVYCDNVTVVEFTADNDIK